MKRTISKLMALVMFAALITVMTGCGEQAANLPITEVAKAEAAGIVAGLNSTDEAAAEEFRAMEKDEVEDFFSQYGYKVDGTAFLNGMDGWLSQAEDLGDIADIPDPEMTSTPEEITATFHLQGSIRPGKCVVTLDERNKITSITTSGVYTVAENMEKAGLNTVLGMGTTFAILIFLSIIIGLFGLIKSPGSKGSKASDKEPVDNVVSQIAEREELAGDDELMAVISAAIAAYEGSAGGAAGASGDSFVVRSIRRHC